MNFFDAKLKNEGGRYSVSVSRCTAELSAEKQENLAANKDVVVIVPTMNAEGKHIDSFHAGDKLNLTFSGNVSHIFNQDGKNLEF